MCTSRTLLKIKGFSEAKVDKLKEACAKLLPSSFITGIEALEKRQQVYRISTGSKEFDKLLGGGVQSLSITEAFGEFRTGKTQLSHTLCVTTQLPVSMGGAEGKVAFIDTEGTFRPERIKEIAARFNVDGEAALENILFARALNSEHQLELINDVAARFAEEQGAYRLLIVDSIISLFRVEFSGRGELADRQQKLNVMLSRLMKVAEEYNVAVWITNQMCSDPGAGMTFMADPKKPVGGHILSHVSFYLFLDTPAVLIKNSYLQFLYHIRPQPPVSISVKVVVKPALSRSLILPMFPKPRPFLVFQLVVFATRMSRLICE